MKKEHLIEALRTYENPIFDSRQKAVVVTLENGRREVIDIHQACEMAADLLEQSDIDALKFRALVRELKQRGMSSLYQSLMGEEIPK